MTDQASSSQGSPKPAKNAKRRRRRGAVELLDPDVLPSFAPVAPAKVPEAVASSSLSSLPVDDSCASSQPPEKIPSYKKSIPCAPVSNNVKETNHLQGLQSRKEKGEDDGKSSQVPYVQVNGKKFYSDRFYLNETIDTCREEVSGVDEFAQCTCGASSSSLSNPTLFCRAKLVESLDLKAAIIGTYTLDMTWMTKEMPSIFSPDGVPTLIVHGHRGMDLTDQKATKRNRKRKTQKATCKNDKHTATTAYKAAATIIAAQKSLGFETKQTKKKLLVPISFDAGEHSSSSGSEDDNGDVPITTKFTQHAVTPDSVCSSTSFFEPNIKVEEQQQQHDQGDPPEEGWRQTTSNDFSANTIGDGCGWPHVHTTEILPAWIPPSEAKKQLKSKGFGVDPVLAQQRRSFRGVHHPKFLLLFETSGSIVVVVSTSNATTPISLDGSWIQRFAPRKRGERADQFIEKNDFGLILADFLHRQMEAARVGQITADHFLQQHLGHSSLDDFRRSYCFQDAQVHLVSTVPGEFDSSSPILYGPQRVASILRHLYGSSHAQDDYRALPPGTLSRQDRILLQTTSFGGSWKRTSMEDVVRMYMEPHDGRKIHDNDDDYGYDILDQVDILWPSQPFMDSVVAARKKTQKERRSEKDDKCCFGREGQQCRPEDQIVHHSVETSSIRLGCGDGAEKESLDGSRIHDDTRGLFSPHFAFLSSSAFNLADLDCLSRMVQYETAHHLQGCSVFSSLSPHIKIVARLLHRPIDVASNRKDCSRRRNSIRNVFEEEFAWLLLSSACLSRGAQGKAVPLRGWESDAVTYSNFELGVLFCSQIHTSQPHLDRIYGWKPTRCTCHQSENEGLYPRRIHLPVPYELRPRPYQSTGEGDSCDDADADMSVTPFFHEIAPGTGSVGNMKLTPLGKALASKRDSPDLQRRT